MEKMTWTRPVAAVEQFMPNEYIAACGDNNIVYKFKYYMLHSKMLVFTK